MYVIALQGGADYKLRVGAEIGESLVYRGDFLVNDPGELTL